MDEINQGLDDRNERFVFRRIVANSTEPPGAEGPTDHDGQYFLITPKLLPNLYDMEVEGMTVLFIFNGTYGCICYFILTSSFRKWASHTLEFFGIFWGLSHFRTFVLCIDYVDSLRK